MNWPYSLRPMWKNRAAPTRCALMTWEYCSTFDRVPLLSEIQEMFVKDMPRRVSLCGGITGVKMWPLVSFNATEGRLWRYLVALPDGSETAIKSHENISVRLLPEQICLVSLANKFLTDQQEGNSGNCVFWGVFHEVLYLLVFFEGRLCHWSEESGYVGLELLLNERLSRFKVFLERDSLFSRADHFEFVELNEIASEFSPQDFVCASRDPFFKPLRLNDSPKRSRKIPWGIITFMVGTVVIFSLRSLSSGIPDVDEVLLDLPPVQETVEERRILPSVALADAISEIRHHSFPHKAAAACVPPDVRIKGLVDGKLAVIETGGLMKSVSVGDTLQSLESKGIPYVIHGISRDRLRLKCRNRLLEVSFQ